MTTKKNPPETRKVIVTIGISLALIVIVTGLYVLYQPKGGAVGKAAATGDFCTDESMVAWWKGEQNADDSSSSGIHDGTWSGNAAYGSGKMGQAFEFKGSNFITVSDASALDITDTLTIEGWIKPMKAANMQIVRKYSNVGGYALAATLDSSDNTKVKFVFYINSFSIVTPGSYAINSFYHVAVKYYTIYLTSSDTVLSYNMKIFINGELAVKSEFNANVPAAIGENNEELKIGGGAGQEFKGQIDELTIYNRALSDDEIAAIFNADSDGKCTTSTVTEICNNSVDDDSDGAVDCDDSDCNGDDACPASNAETCNDGADNDGDGSIDCVDTTDCSSAANCQVTATCNTDNPDCTNSNCFSNPSCQNEDCVAVGTKTVAWSYVLPENQEGLDGGTLPALFNCCKPNECVLTSDVTGTNKCQGINSLDADKNLCDADRNWHQCTEVLESTKSSDGTYECDNQKWEVVCQEATMY